MNKIAIIGDTSQDLNYELGERFGIEVLSYYVQMGENHYKDLVDINSKEFYHEMSKYEILSTGIPPIQEVEDKLNEIKEKGYSDVIIVTSSGKLTGMYSMCWTIKKHYEGLNIYLYDSGHIGASTALFTIRAAELRNNGKNVGEILDELNRVRDKINNLALFRTLSYLVKGGRFNKYKGILGNLLNIKPLLGLEDGEIIIKEKNRGLKRSFSALIKEVKYQIGDSKKYRIIIFSGQSKEEIKEIRIQLAEIINKADLYIETELTPVLGVHAGPEAIGVATMILD